MKPVLASAVNNEAVLNSCLLKSPDTALFEAIKIQRGFSSAAAAYNDVLRSAAVDDLLIFAHQDIYLPPGWWAKIETAVRFLDSEDPNWGVLGVYGINDQRQYFGHLYCTANAAILGAERPGVHRIATLDEIVLIFRARTGLRFDEQVGGFHFYGTDICLEARKAGRSCYSVAAFCIHNANGYGMFPVSFWKGYLDMRRKWKAILPVETPCVTIRRGLSPILWRSVLWRFCWLSASRKPLAKRVENPVALYADLSRSVLIHP